jgi:hypothetical protein
MRYKNKLYLIENTFHFLFFNNFKPFNKKGVTMINLKRIVISGEGYLNDAEFNSIEDADYELFKRKYKAPEKGAGFLKQHCKMIFEDGHVVKMRVDLTNQSPSNALSSEISQFMDYLKNEKTNEFTYLLESEYEGFI